MWLKLADAGSGGPWTGILCPQLKIESSLSAKLDPGGRNLLRIGPGQTRSNISLLPQHYNSCAGVGVCATDSRPNTLIYMLGKCLHVT